MEYCPEEIEPCFVKPKVEPVLTIKRTRAEPPNVFQVKEELLSDFLWFFSRTVKLEDKQTMPGYMGWISMSSESSSAGTQQQTLIDYMKPINVPVTENSSVLKLLQVSKEATHEVGQDYTIVTFDLAVAKKAYAITWQYAAQFHDVFIRMLTHFYWFKVHSQPFMLLKDVFRLGRGQKWIL